MSATRLLSVLNSSNSLISLVSNRIVMSPSNQGLKTPYIVFEFQNDDPLKDLSGTVTSFVRQEWEIIVVGQKFSDIDAIKTAVISVFNAELSQFRANYIQSDYEYDPDTDVHKHILTYQISYQTA